MEIHRSIWHAFILSPSPLIKESQTIGIFPSDKGNTPTHLLSFHRTFDSTTIIKKSDKLNIVCKIIGESPLFVINTIINLVSSIISSTFANS